MASGRQADYVDIRAEIQSVVLNVLRRRANGESLPDEQVIASHPELAEDMRVELAKLKQICVAGDDAEHHSDVMLATTATWDMRANRTPGMLRLQCPHCREPFETATDTPVTEIVCSTCGGHFSLAGENKETRSAASLQTLAHFDLVERLGVGGFGSVWKARDRKLDRTVAVKIPHRGTLNNEDLEKFLREARAAAQLQHPNIVRVHEVGRDGDSAYIVSDFVRGVTLNDWLSGQRPTMRQAVELCIAIADALQHAHDRGVIHRDLKPANILIDAEARPHLMDFGLAKREVGEVTLTLDGQVRGTPAYMSPEQARGESHSADRRSDIYSLGVIFFQLLTGELPFRGNQRMLMHQVINEPAPSPRRYNGTVPKDLETISLKCLEKEPARRYQTAGELSVELNRYLAGEPIQARPISRIARTWRWAKRRPAAAALLALLMVVAVGSATAFVHERDLRREIESERASAEAVVSFLTEDVLAKASPEESQDKTVSDMLVKTLIEPAAAKVGDQFKSEPRTEAVVRHTLAETLRALGRYDLALIHDERSLALRRKVLGEDDPDTLTSMNSLAMDYRAAAQLDEAIKLYEQTLAARRNKLGADHPDTLISTSNLASAYKAAGRLDEAVTLHVQTLAARQNKLGADHPQTLISMGNLANAYHDASRRDEAIPLYEQTLAEMRTKLGPNHPDTLWSLENLAYAYRVAGRSDEAVPLCEQSLAARRKRLGEKHPNTLWSMDNLASAYSAAARFDEATPLHEQTLAARRKVLGEDHPDTLASMHNLAVAYRAAGRTDEAIPLYEQSLAAMTKKLGRDHPDTISMLNNYATVLESLGRTLEAEPMLKQALEQSRKVRGKEHPITISLQKNYAHVVKSLARAREAEPIVNQELEKE